MHHIHIHTPPNTNVCKDAPYTHTCTHVHDMHYELQVHIYAPFTHTCTTKHICVHRCTYTPPKIKIYLVSIPSALYERPGQNERYVLNSALLLLFRCFSYEKCTFHKSAGAFHKKCRCFSWKVQVFSWKVHAFHVLFKRPLARNYNPMFVTVCKMCCVNFNLQLQMCTTYTCIHAQHAP